MLYYTNLDKTVLGMQRNTASSNNIVIVSGYIGYQTIKMLADCCNGVHITIVYGMYGNDSISLPLHNALKEIQCQYPNVEILYSTIPVHSKIYTWNWSVPDRSENCVFVFCGYCPQAGRALLWHCPKKQRLVFFIGIVGLAQ